MIRHASICRRGLAAVFPLIVLFFSFSLSVVAQNSAPAAPSPQNQNSANSVVNELDQNQFDIDFVWEANRNGAPPLRNGRTTRGKLDAEALAKVRKEGVFYTDSLQLPPGQYTVHFVVRNNLNGRIGSVTTPLTVN